MTIQSPLLMGLIALVLTACAMAMGSADDARRMAPVAGSAQAAPFTCVLEAREDGGSVALSGRMTARTAVTATYALRVRGPGVEVDQSGDLRLKANESATLGEATLSGRPEDLDATLTVTTGGRTLACPLLPG